MDTAHPEVAFTRQCAHNTTSADCSAEDIYLAEPAMDAVFHLPNVVFERIDSADVERQNQARNRQYASANVQRCTEHVGISSGGERESID